MENDNCLKKNEKIFVRTYGKPIEKMNALQNFSKVYTKKLNFF